MYVTVEVLKPEDRAAVAADPPALVVLSKADLTGFGEEGPMSAAQARCAGLSVAAGVPVLPLGALLAVAARALDPADWAAVRALAGAGWSCLDESHAGFLTAALPISGQMRVALLEKLDLFGIALGIAAVRQGRDLAAFRALLWRVSGVAEVVAALVAAGAHTRYQRIQHATAQLAALTVGDDRLSEFLSSDEIVLARMGAAEAVLRSAGLDVGPAAPLARARRWHRYSREGPPALRGCGADLARGALRLWSRAGGLPVGVAAR